VNAAAPETVGASIVGDVPKTSDPVPVSFEITPASSADVVAAKAESLLAVSAMVPVVFGPVKFPVPVVNDPPAVVSMEPPPVVSIDPPPAVGVASS